MIDQTKKDGSDNLSDNRSSNGSHSSPPPNPGARGAVEVTQSNGNRSTLPATSPSTLSPTRSSVQPNSNGQESEPLSEMVTKNSSSVPLPAIAEVIRDHTPNAYDKSALRLRVSGMVTIESYYIILLELGW